MDRRNCFNCRFLISFTPPEAEDFRARLAEESLPGDFFGACAHRVPTAPPFIIHRYLDHPVHDCYYWECGYFQDALGLRCPQCKQGEAVVVSPAKNKQTYTLIGCSRYPDCRFATRFLPLDTKCRFCGVRIMLACGDQLVCYCPECKRGSGVPLTVGSWPQLVRSGETCPHHLPWAECDSCQRSFTEKRSLVDIELSAVVAHQSVLRQVEVEAQWADEEGASWGDEWWPRQGSGWSQDHWDAHFEELAIDIMRWGLSFEEGWFYEDQ